LFFFQEEDGIRYRNVTGVQTCALPISHARARHLRAAFADAVLAHVEPGLGTGPTAGGGAHLAVLVQMSEPMDAEGIRDHVLTTRSEERRVGKEGVYGGGQESERAQRKK